MDQPPYDIPLPPGAEPRNESIPNPNNAPPISTGSRKQFEQFEQMYGKWEWQFEEWKRKNMYNPDQEYIDNYNYDMNLMKNRLLERRRILQQKVEQEEREERERANPLAAASSNIEVMKNLNDSIMDVVKEAFETPLKEKRVEFESRWNSGKEPEPEIVDVPTGNVWPKPTSDIDQEYLNFKAAIENSDVGLEEKRVEFEKSWNSSKAQEPEIVDIPTSNVLPKQPSGSTLFLPSSSSTSERKDSLPGLGGGKDPDIIEIDKPTEIITEADRARIASLLDDSDEDDIDAGPAKESRPSNQKYFAGLPQPVKSRNIDQTSRVETLRDNEEETNEDSDIEIIEEEENKRSPRVHHRNEQERKNEEQILENPPQKVENDGLVSALILLRQFTVDNKHIEERDDQIIFDDLSWNKDSLTNFMISSSKAGDEKKEKKYYSLGCLLYFLKNKHLHHPKYVQKATEDNISAVYRPDRKALLDYLYGKETKDLKNIDEMVSLEMPTKSHEFKNSSAEVSGQIGQIITETTIDGDQRIGIKERMERKRKISEETGTKLQENSNVLKRFWVSEKMVDFCTNILKVIPDFNKNVLIIPDLLRLMLEIPTDFNSLSDYA